MRVVMVSGQPDRRTDRRRAGGWRADAAAPSMRRHACTSRMSTSTVVLSRASCVAPHSRKFRSIRSPGRVGAYASHPSYYPTVYILSLRRHQPRDISGNQRLTAHPLHKSCAYSVRLTCAAHGIVTSSFSSFFPSSGRSCVRACLRSSLALSWPAACLARSNRVRIAWPTSSSPSSPRLESCGRKK